MFGAWIVKESFIMLEVLIHVVACILCMNVGNLAFSFDENQADYIYSVLSIWRNSLYIILLTGILAVLPLRATV